jgi:DNA (cytosine-5)-methyltransferase 1
MFHVGDITKLDGGKLVPVDCITGGSPCQDLSIAGKREGLAGERSGLFMEMIRVIREMREGDIKNGRTNEHIRPRFVIWENVAGAFTSNRGEDFRAVLEEFCRVKETDISIPMPDNGKWAHSGAIASDGFSLAWRLMDSQHFGVPQRRKRIALIVDYGGGNAADILFTGEPFVGDITDGRFGKVLPVDEGLRRYFEKGKQEGQGIAGDSEKCPNESDSSYTLKIRSGADTYVKADGSIGTAGKGALV